jgi:ADP-ribose pyrophosphatase YjhB (NUDIX family)
MSDPAIQLISNLIVTNESGQVLLVQYAAGQEASEAEAETRWWLPGQQLTPYEHPEQAATEALAHIPGLIVVDLTLARVQSFRGRRGWHVSFDYRVTAAGGIVGDPELPAAWFEVTALPRTMHGPWESETIRGVLDG